MDNNVVNNNVTDKNVIDNKKKKDLKKQKDKNILDTKIKRINKNILKLIKHKYYHNKGGRYSENYENFNTDFNSILKSPIITIAQINNIILNLCKSSFFHILVRKYNSEFLEQIKTKNKEFIDTIINDDNLFEQIMCEYEEQADTLAMNKIIDNIIDIIKNIYDKFKKINDKIVYHFIKMSSIYNDEKFVNYLNEINYKTDNDKICDLIYNHCVLDYFSLIKEVNLEKTLSSKYFNDTNFDNLTSFIHKYKLDNKINTITDILIDNFINSKLYIQSYIQSYFKLKYNNIINWIIDNKKTTKTYELTSKQKLKLMGYINLLVFINIYNTYDFIGENDMLNFTNNFYTLLQNEYNDIIKKLQDIDILTDKDKFTLIDFIETENIIEQTYYHFITYSFRHRYNENIDFTNNKIWLYDNDKIYHFGYNKTNGTTIKLITKKVLLNFIDIIKNKIEIEKNIKLIYNFNILNYNNNLLTYDEKIEFFKKIYGYELSENKSSEFLSDNSKHKNASLSNSYSGKVTTKDIEYFILYHNQIANFLIQKINFNSCELSNITPSERICQLQILSDEMIKLAFSCGNINFIEHLIDTKYQITLMHLTYLQNCNEKQIHDLLNYFNKYNTLNYFDNFDWYYHLMHIMPTLNIPEIIYNDDNIELRNEFITKIKELDEKNIIKKLDKMNYIEFINYYKTSTEKIKLSVNDIIKFADYNKRQFILNNLKIC